MASDRPLRRLCVRLFEEDFNEVKAIAKATGVAENVIYRAAIHSYVTQVRGKLRKNLDQLGPTSPVPIEIDTDVGPSDEMDPEPCLPLNS